MQVVKTYAQGLFFRLRAVKLAAIIYRIDKEEVL
jgi:hypothetical protein